MSNIPLGKSSNYPQHYAPGILFAVARSDARAALQLEAVVPFRGWDLWNAWELTWLNRSGKPVVATATLRVPADSPNIVESKSLKLYLGSLAMSRYDNTEAVEELIATDLSAIAEAPVSVDVTSAQQTVTDDIQTFPGSCIDELAAECSMKDVAPGLLQHGDTIVSEELHSHLLRSLCPVTGQPDLGSILIRYEGQQIDRGSLLQYLVSFRQHNDFHEACVERIFIDLKRCCRPQRLTVYARYNRRGGIDINPFRSDFEDTAENMRLWRQ